MEYIKRPLVMAKGMRNGEYPTHNLNKGKKRLFKRKWITSLHQYKKDKYRCYGLSPVNKGINVPLYIQSGTAIRITKRFPIEKRPSMGE